MQNPFLRFNIFRSISLIGLFVIVTSFSITVFEDVRIAVEPNQSIGLWGWNGI